MGEGALPVYAVVENVWWSGTRCGNEVFVDVFLQVLLFTDRLLRGVTFKLVRCSTSAYAPKVMPLLVMFVDFIFRITFSPAVTFF